MKLIPVLFLTMFWMPATAALAAGPLATPNGHHVYMAHGRIDALNPATHTIKLTHSAIPALGWPGMTMQFPLKTPGLARGLKVGERVQFDLAKTPSGYAVVRIAPER
ncbi:MAG: copper-binding protein [Acidiferrobacteraceae bacterium]